MDAVEKLIHDEKKQAMYEEESLADLLFDEEYGNLNNAEQCDSCLYERVICLQEGECLLHKQKQVKENSYESKSKERC